MKQELQILSEKYRPKTIDECVLPEDTKKMVKGLIVSGNIPTMLFVGSAGCGKTTLARAIANELGADVLFINASMHGVDAIRTDVTRFASTVSFTNSKKITILDEADGLSPQAQQALRGFIEEFGGNHSIIFTCNFANKMIDAIVSRCKVVDFRIPKNQKNKIAADFLKRVMNILKKENIDFDADAVASLVLKKFPDFRSVLNEIQGYSAGGRIDAGILVSLSDTAFGELISAMKNRKYNDVRRWVAEHNDLDSAAFFRMFYDKASEVLEPKSIPEVVLHLGTYGYRDAFVVDTEINRMAFLTELMVSSNVSWK